MDALPDSVTRRLRDVSDHVARLREELDRELPERLILAGVSALKERARQRDVVGQVAHQTLRLLNQSLTPRGETPDERR